MDLAIGFVLGVVFCGLAGWFLFVRPIRRLLDCGGEGQEWRL